VIHTKRNIVVIGLQPPLLSTGKGPASRRNTSPPFAASVLTENLRKEAEADGETHVILLLMRGPRGERNETGFETMAVDATEGKVLLHETVPASMKTMGFYDGRVALERLNADMTRIAQIVSDLGAGSVALPCAWTSSLADAQELAGLLDARVVLGGTGMFPGFGKMMAEHGAFTVMGPGFGDIELNRRLYGLLTHTDPLSSIPSVLYLANGGAVVELQDQKEREAATSTMHHLAESGKAHLGYLKLDALYKAKGSMLHPYLGENIDDDRFIRMLTRFESTEGDLSLLEDPATVDVYLSYGCPRTCEYCTSPTSRKGQKAQSEDGLERVARSIARLLDKAKKAKVCIWDEFARPKDVIWFLGKIEQSVASKNVTNGERQLQVVFTNGFYPKLWAADAAALKGAFTVFRENMSRMGVKAKIGAFFPAENWGFGDVHFYENKTDTSRIIAGRAKGGLTELLSIFDYVTACAGMDHSLTDPATFDAYLRHLQEGWKGFTETLGESCSITPFFTQTFPRTALSQTPFQILGERITPLMLEGQADAAHLAQLYAFGENFASPAFQARTAEEYNIILDRFFGIWECINGPESVELRRRYGMTISSETAHLLMERLAI
jgi:hypothetical protein